MVTSPNTFTIEKIKEDEMDRECSIHQAEEKCIQGLVEERGQHGKSRHTWKDNIKMDLNRNGKLQTVLPG